MRRLVAPLAVTVVLAIADRSACAQRAAPSTTNSAAATARAASRVVRIADAYRAALLRMQPEYGTFFAVADARNDLLEDRSAAGAARWRRTQDSVLAALDRVPAAALVGTPAEVTAGLLREMIESGRARRVCDDRLWALSPMSNVVVDYAAIAAVQPVGTPALRRAALARWSAYAGLLRTEEANLREGLRRGVVAPAISVRAVIAMTDGILAAPDSASPWADPARRDSDPAFRAAFAAVVHDSVVPAVRRFRTFLHDDYLPHARAEPSVLAMPHGAACYRGAVRASTSLALDPDSLFGATLDSLASAERQRAAFVRARWGTDDVPSVLHRVLDDTATSFRSRDEALATVRVIADSVRAAGSRFFARAPSSALEVRPVPAYEEATSSFGRADPASADGTRPAVFWINLRAAMQPRGRLRVRDLVYHEAVPGHVSQLAAASAREAASPVDRMGWSSGFGEGWAVYASALPAEVGLWVPNDADRLYALDRAVGNVAQQAVELGIHVKRWTREQAIAFEAQHTGLPMVQIERDVDRRIGTLGQGIAYGVGATEVRRLRGEAERALGPRFDLREFDDAVIRNGTVTLPMLRVQVGRWIASRREESGR